MILIYDYSNPEKQTVHFTSSDGDSFCLSLQAGSLALHETDQNGDPMESRDLADFKIIDNWPAKDRFCDQLARQFDRAYDARMAVTWTILLYPDSQIRKEETIYEVTVQARTPEEAEFRAGLEACREFDADGGSFEVLRVFKGEPDNEATRISFNDLAGMPQEYACLMALATSALEVEDHWNFDGLQGLAHMGAYEVGVQALGKAWESREAFFDLIGQAKLFMELEGDNE